ncbi:MAG TPA: hypothetical protein VGS41_10590, partial [Chthonomonadales bacterium]|nr:hypothetical protein [Chthonomonadales bacterium]
ICTRGPHIMQGYWRNPEATSQVLDEDGWFRTGDIGRVDDEGYLYITDRKKDLIVTAYGKNLAPQQLESSLCEDRFIDQACVYGDGKPFLTALIVPSIDLQGWAKEQGMAADSLDELIVCPEVTALYRKRIDLALADFSPSEQVRKFLLLSCPFTFDQGEMTVTAKLRRRQIVARHLADLEALYQVH